MKHLMNMNTSIFINQIITNDGCMSKEGVLSCFNLSSSKILSFPILLH